MNKRQESRRGPEGEGIMMSEFVWIMPPPMALIPLFSVEPPEEEVPVEDEEAPDVGGEDGVRGGR